ncbi:MAG: hypothetical protein LBI80_04770 [Endomicrobium sp.]|jgi:hypothetical protein|nr:hypothetical protein [Endomicrobium sp.]
MLDMKLVDLVLIIAISIIAISIVVGVIYFILTLVQVRKTALEIEIAVSKVNTELDLVNKLSCKVASITEKVSSPVVSMISLLFYVISSINKKNKCKEK